MVATPVKVALSRYLGRLQLHRGGIWLNTGFGPGASLARLEAEFLEADPSPSQRRMTAGLSNLV